MNWSKIYTVKQGRDLLEKLEAEIKFTKGEEIKVIIPETKYMEAATLFVQESHSEIPIKVEKAEDIYPVVANPYTLLTRLTDNLGWFTVLDLKDAFSCIPVHEDSQELFAFEWDNPETGHKVQLTWSVLPQGFKNSPTIFGDQLAIQLTINLLNFLGQSGYRVTKGKAQIAKETLVYLGLEIFRGHRCLSTEWKKVICDLPEPCTVREMQAFLGMVNWYRLWIPDYGLLARPLYGALKTTERGHLVWTDNTRAAFKQLKHALIMAPALGLPDLTKPFELFTYEWLTFAIGVLSQFLGNHRRPVVYFSKQLDTVSQGWPGCLRAVAATVMLNQEARKLTLGQHRVVVFELEKAIISAVMESIENRTMDTIKAVEEEVSSLSHVVLQNRVALDFLLASQGDTKELILHSYSVSEPFALPDLLYSLGQGQTVSILQTGFFAS
ncbi:hypothetical protein WISP_42087 [Willisornis vidua]|uniref:ribonuclease H n=1 Tax=Willisornis vidua TaxID=1566151 RepID=A0ABQ9DHV3_9PASS|nr:hypothetical protein WISP_42087 [Willisornis vidua]